jgi:hypothetical protein
VKEAAKLVKWYGPVWTASGIFENFYDAVPYLGLVIPLAISAPANSMMRLVNAKEAGVVPLELPYT